MRSIPKPHVHPQSCACRRCAPCARANGRLDLALKVATRVLLVIAGLIAIPFIVAHALASAKSDHR
jgi:hypothetical protein